MPKYCSDCGDEITDPSQNFCEKCGAPIPKDDKLKEGTSSQPISTKKSIYSRKFIRYQPELLYSKREILGYLDPPRI